jgi:hypothetical protein
VKRRKKRKKKSSLQKRREDPNSRLWRNKADYLWRKLVARTWDGKCAYCGTTEITQAHHLIPREMYSHRHIIENGILLCARHHKYSFEVSAHRGSIVFYRWLIAHHSDKWEWLMLQKPKRERAETFKEATDRLIVVWER